MIFFNKRSTKGERLTKHKCFFEEILPLSFSIDRNDKVDSTADSFGAFKVSACREFGIIVSVENITADRQLLQKLRIGHLCNIGIAVVLFVTGGVVIHRLFQRGGNTHIVNDKSALFICENTIDTGDGLH